MQYIPYNSYCAVPNRLIAGEYPGTPKVADLPAKLATYLDCGITAFLDLTEAHELTHYHPTLQQLAAARGIDCVYQRLSIRDVDIPQSPAHMQRILRQIAHWHSQQRVVYVHCWGGVGRTGTVIGCQLVESGLTGEAALQRLAQLWLQMSPDKRARRPHSPETPAQSDYVRRWKPGSLG